MVETIMSAQPTQEGRERLLKALETAAEDIKSDEAFLTAVPTTALPYPNFTSIGSSWDSNGQYQEAAREVRCCEDSHGQAVGKIPRQKVTNDHGPQKSAQVAD